MNVMFLAPGRSIHSNNWASAMCDRGHTVHFVTQESFIVNEYSFLDSVDPRLIIHKLPFKGKAGFLFNAVAVKKLTKTIKPDIIHVQQAAGYGFLGTFTDKSKAFVSVYGWEVYDLARKKLWKPLVGYVLHWYKHIGSTSHCMKEQIKIVLKGKNTPIAVTPFGINVNKFKYCGVEKSEIIVGTVKKMDKKYGMEYLIQAFAKALVEMEVLCPSIYERMFLELVGPGNQIDELKMLAAHLGIQGRVRFIGRVTHSDVPKWLNRFDIYAAPSCCIESFGVAVLEASACGCPVVVSNVGGLPEVVVDNQTGCIVPSRDIDELAKILKMLLLDKKKRVEMGKAGIMWVEEKYEWQHCIDIMEDIYNAIHRNEYERLFHQQEAFM